AASNKFLANIKIGASRHRTLTLERSDNGQTLTLDATIDGVGAGKQQVTIEIVASGVADPEPILKTITTATVAAGQTNEGDIKNAPINYETTAKAIAYEAWPASSNQKPISITFSRAGKPRIHAPPLVARPTTPLRSARRRPAVLPVSV
ncbi:MAG: hypothetical protein PHD82_12270, partial [Candidatus Riflebacteria bacterium]|nr:hypothetical protein [Candidatus Riflebacteria bacterium]